MDHSEIAQKLDRYLGKGIEYSNNEWTFFCPKCNHRKRKLAINLDSGAYHCFVCDFRGRGITTMLRRLGHDVSGSFIKERKLTLESIKKFFSPTTPTDEIIPVNLPKGYQRLYSLRFSKFYSLGWEYLKSRGFVENDLLKYNVMYNIVERRVLFPSYDSNFRLNYYLSRSIDEGEYIRYQNADVKKSEIVFNEYLIDWDRELFVVEGVFDSVLSRLNSVPLLGSALSPKHHLFHKIMYHDSSVVLCLDVDAQDKQIQIAEMLQQNGIRVKHFTWNNTSGDKDVADLGSRFLDFGKIKTHDFKDNLLMKIKTGRGLICQPTTRNTNV